MKAVVLNKTGGPKVLQIEDVPNPELTPDGVKIDISFSGINYADLLSRQGRYRWSPKRPYILGLEASGTVSEVGDNVTRFKKGDKVLTGVQHGAYAEEVVAPERQVFHSPSHFSDEHAASFIATWGTSWIGLTEMARVRSGERLLVHAAAGGVGTAAILLGNALGLEVYGTASSSNKREFIESLGATALTYDNFDTEMKNTPPDCVIETIGGDIYKRSFKLLSPMGRVILIGATGIQINKWNVLSWYKAWKAMPKTNIQRVIKYSKAFMGVHVGYLLEQVENINQFTNPLFELVSKNNLSPIVHQDHIFPMSKVADAHQFIHDRKNIGKVLLIPNK